MKNKPSINSISSLFSFLFFSLLDVFKAHFIDLFSFPLRFNTDLLWTPLSRRSEFRHDHRFTRETQTIEPKRKEVANVTEGIFPSGKVRERIASRSIDRSCLISLYAIENFFLICESSSFAIERVANDTFPRLHRSPFPPANERQSHGTCFTTRDLKKRSGDSFRRLGNPY